MINFDLSINRKKTGSLKWDLEPELMPYWVADMDFPSPDCILEALHQRVNHGIFGYTLATEEFEQTLLDYFKNTHATKIQTDWIVHLGGCVPALAIVAMGNCSADNSIMTCSPVYPPIRSIHETIGASIIEIPHILKNGKWTFDWEEMEKKVLPCTKIFVLCNPQNPLGRVFSREELLQLADFCERHDLILCADEIHCDLILDPELRHTTTISLPEKYLDRIIMLTAPSKTYNIAGIGYSMAIIPSPSLREKFELVRHQTQPPVHCLAFSSAEAAYRNGEPWRKELIAYLQSNRKILYDFIGENIPQIKLHPMQATYLAWMDCSALDMEHPQQFFAEKAGIFLTPGAPFGAPRHVRFNFATSASNMQYGLEKMALAVHNLKK